MKLVLPDHTEVSIDDMEKIKAGAIADWHRAQRAEKRAQTKQQDCETIISACASRIRLLTILERNE